jgi:hypothetical protein
LSRIIFGNVLATRYWLLAAGQKRETRSRQGQSKKFHKKFLAVIRYLLMVIGMWPAGCSQEQVSVNR